MVNNSKNCPNGFILRKGYTRKFSNNVKKLGFTVRRKGKTFTVYPKKNQTHVSNTCIRNRGLPGKGPKEGEGIGKLRKGKLLKYGYQYRLSDALRRSALKKAIEHYGPLSVYHMLDAVAKYSKRTAPDASDIFTKDRNWIQSHYTLKKVI